jgi:hypothetical protein
MLTKIYIKSYFPIFLLFKILGCYNPRGMGVAPGLCPSLSPPQDGRLARAPKLYEGLTAMSKGHIDAAVGGAFLSLTINNATTLIEKRVATQS